MHDIIPYTLHYVIVPSYLFLETGENVGESLNLSQWFVGLNVLGGPLLRVFSVLILEKLELRATLPDDLGELLLHLGNVLGAGDLKVVVQPDQVAIKNTFFVIEVP
jgi:hypothetical protein